MKIQEALLSNGAKMWLVLDGEYQPVAPIMRYLRYLESLRRSPNTLRAYALDLKLYWEFLEQNVLNWGDIKVGEVASLLQVSRSTAARYLQEFEREGIIEKITPTPSRQTHYFTLKILD